MAFYEGSIGVIIRDLIGFDLGSIGILIRFYRHSIKILEGSYQDSIRDFIRIIQGPYVDGFFNDSIL